MATAMEIDAGEQRPLYIDELEPGIMRERITTVTRDCIETFGNVSGDLNPVHFCDDYASQTMFGGVIAHGMLSAAYFSAVIAGELPGPGSIYLGQTLRFKAPVRPGDTVRARCEVAEVDAEKRRVTLRCEAWVGDKIVLEGEALVMPPKRPKA